MSFIRTGLREIGLKIRRQRTRMILRHEKRLLQKSEIVLGREGTSQAANFPELRNEIVALKKLEQEQKEVALRIAQIEEGIKKIEAQREANAKVAVKDRETVVLGGFISNNRTDGKSGVPFLKDLPLLGALSGSTSSSTVAQVSLFLVMGSVGIFRR